MENPAGNQRGPTYEFRSKKRARPRTILSVAGVCVGALAAMGLLRLRAASSPAKPSPAEIVSAIDAVRRAKVTKWAITQGKRELSEIDYFDNGSWRVDRIGVDTWIFTPLWVLQYEIGCDLAVLYRASSAPGVSYMGHRRGYLSSNLLGPSPLSVLQSADTAPLNNGAHYTFTTPYGVAYEVDARTKRILGWSQREVRRNGVSVLVSEAQVDYMPSLPESMCDILQFPRRKAAIADLSRTAQQEFRGVLASAGTSAEALEIRAAMFNSAGELVLVRSGAYSLGSLVDEHGDSYVSVGTSWMVDGLACDRFVPVSRSLPDIPCRFTMKASTPRRLNVRPLPPLSFAVRERISTLEPPYFLEVQDPNPRPSDSQDRNRALLRWFMNHGLKSSPAGQQVADRAALMTALAYAKKVIAAEIADPRTMSAFLQRDYSDLASLFQVLGMTENAHKAKGIADSYGPSPTLGYKVATVDQ